MFTCSIDILRIKRSDYLRKQNMHKVLNNTRIYNALKALAKNEYKAEESL